MDADVEQLYKELCLKDKFPKGSYQKKAGLNENRSWAVVGYGHSTMGFAKLRGEEHVFNFCCVLGSRMFERS
ncbi:hypothetical protein INR49_009167 [Caranx melampygus]|nr:hypothetical protein INR49_009167 [Caranx melampygus]